MFLFCLVFAMSLCASIHICFVVTCWERADLLALVCGVCCEFVTFPLVSWVRCGTWLYRFLIFAPLLTLLGDSLPLDDKVIDCCEEFICRLYRPNSDITDLNHLRYKMFCKTPVKNPSLSPCYDSMLQHLNRCNYQSYIWKSALVA